MLSPSRSVAVYWQVKSSFMPAGSGSMLTEVTTGGVLPITRLSVSAVPEPEPSLGVTVQLTVSFSMKPLVKVLVYPALLPFTCQRIVDWSWSPSTSSKL